MGDRLQPTIDIAISEKDKYAAKAKMSGYALNAAIGMQVVLGSLTTGLSALSVVGGASVNTFLTLYTRYLTFIGSRWLFIEDCKGNHSPWYVIMRRVIPTGALLNVFFLHRCLSYLGSFISCPC